MPSKTRGSSPKSAAGPEPSKRGQSKPEPPTLRDDLMVWDQEAGAIRFGGQSLSVPAGGVFQTTNGDVFYTATYTDFEVAAHSALLDQVVNDPGVFITTSDRTRLSWLLDRLRALPIPTDILFIYKAPLIEVIPSLDELLEAS